MSTPILFISSERYSGKSTLIVGIAMELKDQGYKVGYMKPIGTRPIKVDNVRVDEDAYFVGEALGLIDDIKDMSPYLLSGDSLPRYMRRKPKDPSAKVKRSFGRISSGKDIVLLEGAQNFSQGEVLGLSALKLSKLLDVPIVVMESFNEELSVDRMLFAKDYFGERLIGVILNWVPKSGYGFIENLLPRYLDQSGIDVLGWIPTDSVLRSISIGDLASELGGEIICAKDWADELVESMMVGAMGLEQALALFRKRADKVVVTGGDRSDIQLAALETPTKALILTGGHGPNALVMRQAEEMHVPIILVNHDTVTTVELVEKAIENQKVHGEIKVERIRYFVRENIDIDGIIEKSKQLQLHMRDSLK
ncbi:MAG: phosphotransacetylase family protein [Actinomycetota bacterium]|nr:phosphotransacetylase family protein [Actinomycetota bacterium]